MTALAASAVLLAGLCFTGLAFAALLALERGAAAYGAGYSSRTSRAFEDLFLFIPPRRLAEIAWIAAAAVAGSRGALARTCDAIESVLSAPRP